MKIGVLSDTHIPKRAKQLPAFLLDQLKSVDHIIHAGDICDMSVVETLHKLAPVTAVYGNADALETKECLNETEIVTLDSVKIGVFHGHGDKGKTLDRAIAKFKGQNVNCVIFGHSHMPYCRYHGGTLLLNPGSPTDKRRNPYYSYGILETGETLRPQIIFFDAVGRIVTAEVAG